APVAQGIERCPAEAEVACSNHAGRTSPRGNRLASLAVTFPCGVATGLSSAAKSGKARLRGELELRVGRDLDADIAQGNTRNGARYPANRFAFERQVITGSGLPFDIEDSEAAVELAAVVLARDRLLAGIAALREADVRLR